MLSFIRFFAMKLLITCPFWLWSLLSHEIKKIGYLPESTFQTWTFVDCDMKGMMKINYHSRLANKVYIQLIEWKTTNFDELFDLIKSCNYSQFTSNTNISIKVESKNSLLTSTRAIQSVSHKALLESISKFWVEEKHINELLLVIDHNIAKLYLNTSWSALHQRWYKKEVWEAPLKENLAAALLILSWWKVKYPLVDPFCWSWTIAIEAALIAKNIAPWSWRRFNFELFKNFEHKNFSSIKEEAKGQQFSWEYSISAYDLDPKMVKIAQSNAFNAWVSDLVTFRQTDFIKLDIHSLWKSWIVCNPPYGKRLYDSNLSLLYKKLEGFIKNDIYWWWISSYKYPLKNANNWNIKKLYNWAEECNFYWRKN